MFHTYMWIKGAVVVGSIAAFAPAVTSLWANPLQQAPATQRTETPATAQLIGTSLPGEVCPGKGDCGKAHDTPGCNDEACCLLVCEIEPICCIVEWEDTCVKVAISEGCVAGPGEQAFIATGTDDSIDGYMDVLSDGLGSQAAAFNGGPDWSDHYNPVGGPLQAPSFTTTTFLYTDSTALAMTLHSGSATVWGPHGIFLLINSDPGATDTNADGVNDTRVVDFSVSGGLSLDITCTQHVERFLAEGGSPVATWTVAYDITNTGAATSFRMVRWGDVNSNWVGDANDDIVGTGTNDAIDCDRFIYIGEDGAPNYSITLSTNLPDTAYVGSKMNYDPDCAGSDPPFGSGTDPDQVWLLHGFYNSYFNHIAGVGQDADGESGTAPDDGCDVPAIGTDASVGLQSTIELGAGQSTTVVYKYTYGAITPDGANCGGGGGGIVYPHDFNAFRGFHDSGTLDDVLASDDSDLCHDLGITIFPVEAPITLDFDGTLPNDSPASLDVTFESSANTPGLELTILMWNYNTNSWDVIGTATQGFNADAVRTFPATPADHVEAGTGNVRTRYEVRHVSIIFQFPWTDCIDEMFWTHN